MKYLLTISVLLIGISGFGVFAEAQTMMCPALSRTLSFGDSGDDVAELQRFLQGTRDFRYLQATGYFGELTQTAVQRFQCREMGLCSGSPDENGYGVVGPRTRARISAICSRDAQNTPTFNQGDTYSQGGYTTTNTTVYNQGAYYDQGTYYAEGSYGNTDDTDTDAYSQPAYYTQATYYSQSSYAGKTLYAESAYYSQGGYSQYSQGGYYTQSSYLTSTNGACTLDGKTIAHGESVMAYQYVPTVSLQPCLTEIRTCNNGILTGSYPLVNCRVTTK